MVNQKCGKPQQSPPSISNHKPPCGERGASFRAEENFTAQRPNITLAQKHPGWQPTIPLEESLARTTSYFRTQL
jgi:nucleoside-diphosphate-sugar epimerase